MPSDITFQGRRIFNSHEYPGPVDTQSRAMLEQIGKNVDLTYATINESSAMNDLASIGFSLRHKSATQTMSSVDASVVDDKVSSLVRDFFEEDIKVVRGTHVSMALIQNAIDNHVSSYSNHVLQSQGSYCSYQLTFYSMRKTSFCFLVLAFVALKNESSVFGVRTEFRTVSYKAQIFECKKVLNSVIYNFGTLRSGECMRSPDGQHIATLAEDGNFRVGPANTLAGLTAAFGPLAAVLEGALSDMTPGLAHIAPRWQTNSANKGTAPRYLAMQSDANLVIYDTNGRPVWASGSQPRKSSRGPYRLQLQNDGNLVIYDAGDSPMWNIGPA